MLEEEDLIVLRILGHFSMLSSSGPVVRVRPGQSVYAIAVRTLPVLTACVGSRTPFWPWKGPLVWYRLVKFCCENCVSGYLFFTRNP